MVTLSKSLFKSELRKEVIYYSRNNINYSDNIIFHNKTISLSGSRTKHMDNTNILETVNSSFYSCLTKALLFAYFERGCFKVKSITVCIDEDDSNIKKYEEKEIKQVFIKEKLVEVNSIKLFSNKDISDTMMNSLMNLTLSFNEKDLRFDYTWKCFNSLIRDIFKEKKDFHMLKKLREDLELNPGLYPNILSFSKNIDFNYLNQCFLKAMICNNFPKGSTQGLVSFFKDFKDIRIITTLKKVMKCKKMI